MRDVFQDLVSEREKSHGSREPDEEWIFRANERHETP